MSYERQNFLENQVVTEAELNHMEDGIIAACHVQNLLDNSDFTNPVNQRGASSYDSEQYAIDRWRVYDSKVATCTVNSDSITVSSRLYQNIPGDGFDTASPYTLAACDSDGNIRILTTKTLKSSTSNDYMGFEYPTTSCVTVYLATGTWKWAALYKGAYTEDTLPAYVPKGYTQELLECQRYYYKIPCDSNVAYPGFYSSATQARVTVACPVTMRVTPSLSVGDVTQMRTFHSGGTAFTPTAASVLSCDGRCVVLALTVSSATAWSACTARFNTTAALSADL